MFRKETGKGINYENILGKEKRNPIEDTLRISNYISVRKRMKLRLSYFQLE